MHVDRLMLTVFVMLKQQQQLPQHVAWQIMVVVCNKALPVIKLAMAHSSAGEICYGCRSHTVARPHSMSAAEIPKTLPNLLANVLAVSSCKCRFALRVVLQPGRPACKA